MNIRLEQSDIESIIKSFKECFEEQDRLWIFGSRVHLNKRGGDIDLYIEVVDFDIDKVHEQRQNFWVLLQDRLGEQKIDIVVKNPKCDLLIYKVASTEGIQLV
jgi:hypothetical protein